MMPYDESKTTDIWGQVPDTLEVRIRHPRTLPDAEDSLPYHAARLLILIYFSGDPKTKSIEGRTKLAKMDFLIRYPTYLAEAARLKNVKTTVTPSIMPESRMIRYKYGPWDERYYNIFAFLVAKDLVEILPNKTNGDIFQLTKKGEGAVEELIGPEFEELITRCQLVYRLFGKSSGATIKRFIYHYFTDIIDKPLGEEIEGADA